MSNALAIGAVTAVIKNLLENGLVKQGIAASLGDAPTVTVVLPNLDGTNGTTPAKDRLNLFLYQTTFNSGWRNLGLPTRNSSGERVANPPLALDLHYLLTAYSQEAFHAEIMLGYAMQLFHETPVLTRDVIRTALQSLASSEKPALKSLSVVDLAEQVEQIKISPQPMSTEEMSKLWSAIQTQYRPTAAYHVSVVLIESQRSLKSALPVRERRLHVLPLRQLVITQVQPQIVAPGNLLTLQGQNLMAERVQVKFGSVTVEPMKVGDREIQVNVPTGLQAGISTVQIVHLLDLGAPSGLHRGFESNILPFVLRPRILRLEAPTGIIAGRADIQVTVEPIIGKGQRVTLLLNEQNSDTATAYTATIDKSTEDTNVITIPVAGLKAGRYLVRIQVDGAESLPEVDENLYSGEPTVAIACAQNCLRVTQDDIQLTTTLDGNLLIVEGIVTVKDQTSALLPDVKVAITWTLPDGSTRIDTGNTAADGTTTFRIIGIPGTYILTVTNLTKPGFCFDPPEDTTQIPPRRTLPFNSATQSS
ncbi:MAG: DUF4255 domain-containing protein [Komarekiella atlantica HA4396-MV6]|jgi:hypothetical protein|nr:DUF4255 domain-containing protein [Komarekiella atlantica HA4396-MV6]